MKLKNEPAELNLMLLPEVEQHPSFLLMVKTGTGLLTIDKPLTLKLKVFLKPIISLTLSGRLRYYLCQEFRRQLFFAGNGRCLTRKRLGKRLNHFPHLQTLCYG